ncbi:hypothetical protein ACIBG8_28050 [Nonomuraea sp. NPDC050556]|uniref:hypothetical protein n=1 Tax=Nonomuraea sp. NPDC050556 TaxID=3364369 RepID=UPI0037AC4DD4
MTVVRRLMSAAVIVPCVGGSIALGGSAQAAAAVRASGEITSPSNGQVITSGSVQISARTTWTQLSMGLYVEGPSTPKTKVASGGANQTLSGTFDAGSAPNGSFTVSLAGEITKTVYETSTFKLKRPAAEPGNVNANLQGTDKIQVTWAKGNEPDLQSYEVFTSQSGSLGQLSVDKACSGSTCQAVLAVPAKAAGQRVGFLVRAFRSDGEGGTLGSGASNAAFVNIPAPPAPKPTKTAQPTQQAANPGKQTTGKTEDLPQLPGKDKDKVKPTIAPTTRTVPKDTNKLPTMPATDKKGNFTLPPADADQPADTDKSADDGALTPTADNTDNPPKDDTKTVDTSVKAQSSESSIGNIGQYGLYVAGGLILLLLAAHGGAWARRRALAGAAAGGPASSGAAGGPVGPATAGPSAPGAYPMADSIPPTATAPRRPAVVLAVAKPRQQQPPVGQQPGDFRQPADFRPYPGDPRGEEPALEPRAGEIGAQQVPEQRHQVPVSLPLYLSAQDLQAAEPRQEPVRLALPSSAVTVVPEQMSAAVPPAVRLEDRWDDYLPPAPRSMEDSGFWERPQPGDFWAPDDDDAHPGPRRPRGDES